MKYNLFLLVLFLSFLIFANGGDEPTGIVGLTQKDGGTGCICHNFEADPLVKAWIEGPDSLVISDTVNYKLFLTGGAAVKGGFNVANLRGKIMPVDSLTKLFEFVPGDSQLTHTMPLNFSGDTIFWSFKYIAPDSITADTIYSVANSVNGDGNPTPEDKWNFGVSFPIKIYDRPVNVVKGNLPVNSFMLNQNYPNPFNPSTGISFQIPQQSNVILKIYDLIGREIKTLINDELSSGSYKINFEAAGLPSGIYFYQLTAGNFSEVKKMVLLK